MPTSMQSSIDEDDVDVTDSDDGDDDAGILSIANDYSETSIPSLMKTKIYQQCALHALLGRRTSQQRNSY